MTKKSKESVNHPQHYNALGADCRRCGSPIECIDVVEKMPFNLGNAVKYLWRHDQKGGIEDLKKAIWYIQREIENRNRKLNKWIKEAIIKQVDAASARSPSCQKQPPKKRSTGKVSKPPKNKGKS